MENIQEKKHVLSDFLHFNFNSQKDFSISLSIFSSFVPRLPCFWPATPRIGSTPPRRVAPGLLAPKAAGGDTASHLTQPRQHHYGEKPLGGSSSPPTPILQRTLMAREGW